MQNENKIVDKHPDHSPVIINLDSKALTIDSTKFLAQNDLVFGNFLNIIKKKLHNIKDAEINLIKFHIIQEGGKKISITDDIHNSTVKQVFDKYRNQTSNTLFINVHKQTTYKWLKKKSFGMFGFSK